MLLPATQASVFYAPYRDIAYPIMVTSSLMALTCYSNLCPAIFDSRFPGRDWPYLYSLQAHKIATISHTAG